MKNGPLVPLKLPIGINKEAVPLALQGINDSPDMENVVLDKGSIRVRGGETGYIDKAYNNIATGVRSMFRYRTEGGTKKVVINSGIYIYGDTTDNGQFDLLAPLGQNADGFVDFTQYRDSLGMFIEGADPKWYNADASPITIQPNLVPIDFTTGGGAALNTSTANTGGALLSEHYQWRVTFDIMLGNDFLGETSSAGVPTPGALNQWHLKTYDFSGGTETNIVNFLRPSNAVVDAIPAYVSRINFYRSPPSSVAWVFPDMTEETNLFRIGSVAMSAVRAAAENDIIFTDIGMQIGPETPQISHNVRWYPIRPRYTAMHKGRLWCTYCNVAPNASSAVYKLDVDGVYYTRFVANGVEPIVFQSAAPKISINPQGEGNTGIVSWRNKALLVFKPRETHIIIGGDDSLSETIPNIQHEILSPTIGCVAPETIVQAENAIMWWSHRGPEIFDGTGPRPLNSDKIRPLLKLVAPTKRRNMVAHYDSEDRVYRVFYARLTEPIGNQRSFDYSFKTREWTLGKYERGVGSVLEINDTDTVQRLLYGLDDDPAHFDTFDNDPIIVYGKSLYKNVSGSNLSWYFHFPPFAFGDETMSKTISGIRIAGKWTDTVQAYFIVYHKGGILNTSATPFSVDPPGGGQGISEAIPIPQSAAISGQFITLVVQGETSTGQTDITSAWLERVDVGRA